MYSMAFHGKAKERGVVLDDFISGDLKVCVCTDLAARGIDFPELHHVVHYSLADSAAIHTQNREELPEPVSLDRIIAPYCTIKRKLILRILLDDLKELLFLENQIIIVSQATSTRWQQQHLAAAATPQCL